jgi:hypothetical protein
MDDFGFKMIASLLAFLWVGIIMETVALITLSCLIIAGVL